MFVRIRHQRGSIDNIIVVDDIIVVEMIQTTATPVTEHLFDRVMSYLYNFRCYVLPFTSYVISQVTDFGGYLCYLLVLIL